MTTIDLSADDAEYLHELVKDDYWDYPVAEYPQNVTDLLSRLIAACSDPTKAPPTGAGSGAD